MEQKEKRIFIGIFLDNHTSNQIEEIQSKLKGASTSGVFVAKENIHITLSFIGNVQSKSLDELIQRLKI